MVDFVMGPHNNYDCTVQKDKSFSWLVADTVSLVGYVCRVSYTYDIFIEQMMINGFGNTNPFFSGQNHHQERKKHKSK